MSATFVSSSLTGREVVRITTADAIPLKEVSDGTEINYCDYVIQNIVNEETGEQFDSLLIRDDTGKVYATRSESFRKQLFEIIDTLTAMGEDIKSEPLVLRIIKSNSKNNREFVTCALA